MLFGKKFIYVKKKNRLEMKNSVAECIKSEEEMRIEEKEAVEEIFSEIIKGSMDKRYLSGDY